jgi:hypothetical protein
MGSLVWSLYFAQVSRTINATQRDEEQQASQDDVAGLRKNPLLTFVV